MSLTEEEWEVAWRLYVGEGIVHLDHCGHYYLENTERWKLDNSAQRELGVQDKLPNAEATLLKKESFQLLSDEAKEVIDMIFNSPAETVKALSTPSGLLTKRSIKLGLYKIWNSKFIAKQVIEELTRWVNHL
jgi:hypothetical protein